MKLSFEVLEALDAIDRTGTFAEAAELLHRVPSSLSYLVQKLESDLDVALFDRTGRRARLTHAGRVVVEDGRRLLLAGRRATGTAGATHSGRLGSGAAKSVSTRSCRSMLSGPMYTRSTT
jgi:DNA-binding transcriptional LysR family regulator